MIASLVFAASRRRFLAACHHPLEAQAGRLRQILRQASKTQRGQTAGFDALSRIGNATALVRAFQERIPIQTHQEMRADLEAVYCGDWRILCPSRPRFFAMTAGSTGRFKYIPVTSEFLHEVGRGSLIYYGALEARFPELRSLKCQFLPGSAEGGLSPGGVPQGFASGFNYKRLPRLIRNRFLLPYWIFTLERAEDRNYAAGRLLVGDRRLGVLSAISPVNLINLREALELNVERLLADVEAGTLTVRGQSAVAGTHRGRPAPALARRLRQAWSSEGRLPDRLLFPSLTVLASWQGGNMSYYLPELDRSFGHRHRFEFPISASEGVFAIPCEADLAGGALAVTSHFLEFVPEGSPDRALRADQLEIGAEYRLVVTNGGGLYRYDMEDIVRVTSYCHRTPVIQFVCKKDRQVSIANERLTELDVTVAMRAAGTACGVWCRTFLFVPCSDRRYRVLLDPSGHTPATQTELRSFAAALERSLRTASRGYEFERDDALLEPLELMLTRAGALTDYLAGLHSDCPLPNAQIKPRHLTREFDLHRRLHAVQLDAV